MKKKQDLRILKTKASLYRGLMELMKKKTFEEIKISEICAASSINRSTFYDHFNDKNELLQSLIQDLVLELEKEMVVDKKTHSIKEYYNELIWILLTHIERNISIYSAVVKINSNSIAKDMMTEVIINSATKEIEDNYKNTSIVSVKTFVLFYASGFINVILDSLNDEKAFNKEKLYEVLKLLNSGTNIIK